MVIRTLLECLEVGVRVILEYFDAIRCFKVEVFAGQGKDRMHETLVFGSNGYENVLEGVLVFAFYGENGAEVGVVVLPEDHVLCILKTMEYGLQSDDWKCMGVMKTICLAVSAQC